MSRGDFGYGSAARPYHDDPDQSESQSNPFDRPSSGGYQGGSGTSLGLEMFCLFNVVDFELLNFLFKY